MNIGSRNKDDGNEVRTKLLNRNETKSQVASIDCFMASKFPRDTVPRRRQETSYVEIDEEKPRANQFDPSTNSGDVIISCTKLYICNCLFEVSTMNLELETPTLPRHMASTVVSRGQRMSTVVFNYYFMVHTSNKNNLMRLSV